MRKVSSLVIYALLDHWWIVMPQWGSGGLGSAGLPVSFPESFKEVVLALRPCVEGFFKQAPGHEVYLFK